MRLFDCQRIDQSFWRRKQKGSSKCEAGMFQSLLTARDNALDVTHNGWWTRMAGMSLHPGYPVFSSTYIISILVSHALNKAARGIRLMRLKERVHEGCRDASPPRTFLYKRGWHSTGRVRSGGWQREVGRVMEASPRPRGAPVCYFLKYATNLNKIYIEYEGMVQRYGL